MKPESSEEKQISDPSFGWADFKQQLFGGKLRWFFAIFALGGGAFFGYLISNDKPPELDFPFHLEGPVLFWVIGGATVCYLFLAVVNWWSWAKRAK